MPLIPVIAAAALLAAVHLLSPRLTFLDETPRSRWLSAAAGISTAYVFVHLLPELAHLQSHALDVEGMPTTGAEIFLLALLGLMTFYGLERWTKSHGAADDRDRALPAAAFWIHLGSFALYNVLVGYLLPERMADHGLIGLVIYGFAMALHFVVNDRGLYAHHGPRYLAQGRLVLALAPFIGVTLGAVAAVPDAVLAAVLAFLGGGIILNVMKEELPEERQSRFSAFALGAIGYAGFLYLLA